MFIEVQRALSSFLKMKLKTTIKYVAKISQNNMLMYFFKLILFFFALINKNYSGFVISIIIATNSQIFKQAMLVLYEIF